MNSKTFLAGIVPYEGRSFDTICSLNHGTSKEKVEGELWRCFNERFVDAYLTIEGLLYYRIFTNEGDTNEK